MTTEAVSIQPKILIVNDHSPTLLALESILEQERQQRQYDVVSVTSGAEALRQVLAQHFAVILLDVSMPEMDGFETAELIHSRLSSSDTPIIFLTAHYENEVYRSRGYQLGAVDFLVTPVLPEVLRSKVAVFVELEKRTIALEDKTRELEDLNKSLQAARLRELQHHNGLLQAEVAERKVAEEQAYHLATRDPLTGLLNRRFLMEELDQALQEAKRRQDVLALLFLDLNRFKEVNDRLGHEAGDALLAETGRRIERSLREIDRVARFGGDEFVVLLKNIQSAPPSHIERVVEKLRAAIAIPLEWMGHQLAVSASIGVAVYPGDSTAPAGLLRHADMAMYQSKRMRRQQELQR